jgi:cation:H+ antiporter
MDVASALGWIGLGLILLMGGGDALVRGAASIARLARVTPAVIGLTIVAMGTSLPELAVALLARLKGLPDMAMGNVIGSNIFNIAAILGFSSLFVALRAHGSSVRLELPFMFISSCLALLLARDHLIDRTEGSFFVLSLILFTVFTVWLARREVAGQEAAEFEAKVGSLTRPSRLRSTTVSIGLVVAGIAALVVGARFLVDGAVRLAELAGMSERVIGLTIVAVGTGLPELATSIVAALRRQTQIAVANVIGSNIFNILGTVGIISVMKPTTVAPALVSSDMWWMLAFTFCLFPILHRGFRVVRAEGLVLLAGYGVYLWLLL